MQQRPPHEWGVSIISYAANFVYLRRLEGRLFLRSAQKHHAAAMPSTSDATLQSASPFHPVLQKQLVLLILGERRYHARFFFRLAAVW